MSSIEFATVFAPGAAERPPADVGRVVRDALAILPADARTVAAIVNDPQRHTATGAVWQQLVARIAPTRLRVLVACGSHPAPTSAERRAFEDSIFAGLPPAAAQWHDCRDPELLLIEHVQRRRGASWLGHPWLLESDAVLAVGSVEPHYFAGWTGAHKTCTIGVAATADIEHNHAHALSPSCRPAVLEDNPVADDVLAMLDSLESRKPVAAVNLVQAGRDLLAAAGGSPRDALAACFRCVSAAFVRRIDKPADALVAEVTGPLAESFYQADKGIKNNESAVRDGGGLVLVAACPGGIGQDRFTDLLRRAASYGEALAAVEADGYRLGDHKAVRLRRLTDPACRAVRACVISDGLSAADAALLGLRKAPTVAAALAEAGIDAARDRVVGIRDAGNLCVLPEVEPRRRC